MIGSKLRVVDSSVWLEFLADEPRAEEFYRLMEPVETILLPTVVVYEVSKKLRATRGPLAAEQFISVAQRAQLVSLDHDIAVAAASVSLDHRLAMADAMIYATARAFQVQLFTSDAHFDGLPGVQLL